MPLQRSQQASLNILLVIMTFASISYPFAFAPRNSSFASVENLLPPVALVALAHLFVHGLLVDPSHISLARFAHLTAMLLVGTLFIHVLAVLMGASLISGAARTLLLSAMMSSITFIPLSACAVDELWNWAKPMVNIFRAPHRVQFALFGAVGAFAGAWFGAIAIPLDWERWYQEWPLSCWYGSTLGYGASSTICAFMVLSRLL